MAAVTAVGRALNSNMEVSTSGAVYVYTTSNNWDWAYSTTLSSEATDDGFGTGLSVGDSLIAVGAPYDSRWVEYAGAVYIYTGVAPSFTTSTIYSEHADKEAYFGASVAVVKSLSNFKNGAVVVAAPGHNHDGHKQVGAVFIYCKQYGSIYYKMNMMLEPSEMKDNGQMGYALSAYGNMLAVGAPGANAVYVFELMQHVEDCPPGHEDHSNLPQGACSSYRRVLQEGGPEGGEGKEGENRDQKDHEQEEREREEREYQNRNVYYTWKYEEIIDIHLEDDSFKDAMFGGSVAIYNDTVLTVVAGAPDMTSAVSGDTDAGAVYVLSVMSKNDLWSNFAPEGYHKEEEHHHIRRLQGGDHHEEDRRHPKWDPTKNNVGWDSLGNFWLKEKVEYGSSAGEQFGYAVAADYTNLFVGSNNENAFGAGSVQVYQRQATNVQDYDRPVISGPLFKRVFMLSGTLSDSQGNNGDKFGTSLALYKNQALIGAYLKGITSATSVGTGAAYIYNAITYHARPTSAPTPVPVAAEKTLFSRLTNSDGHINSSGAMTIAFVSTLLLLASVMGAYGVYKYQGGKTDVLVVMGAGWDSVKEFGSSISNKLGGGGSSTRVSLSHMDDSTNSVTPMTMDSSRGSFASSQSSNSVQPNRFQSQAGAHSRNYPPQGQQQMRPYPQQGQPPQPPRSYPPQGGQFQGAPPQQYARPQPRPGQPRPAPRNVNNVRAGGAPPGGFGQL